MFSRHPFYKIILPIVLLIIVSSIPIAHADSEFLNPNNDKAIISADAAAVLRSENVYFEKVSSRTYANCLLLYCVGLIDNTVSIPNTFDDSLHINKNLDCFSYLEILSDEQNYIDSNIAAHVTKTKAYRSDCYVVDIFLRDITKLKTAFSDGVYNSKKRTSVLDLSMQNNAYAAITGDFYVLNARGSIVRNGIKYTNKNAVSSSRDILVLKKDSGSFDIYEKGSLKIDQFLEDENIWQMWVFGPTLLDPDGNVKTSFHITPTLEGKNPRVAIGYYEPGHYCFVTVDGRKSFSKGMRLTELSKFMKQLGCVSAYNLDGGKSACMVFMDSVVNRPSSGGRDVSDIVYIGD